MNKKQFLFLNLNIEKISIYYGSFLILWGLLISYISNSTSLTSYIPSFLGMPVLIFSLLSVKLPSKKKLFMHLTALMGFIIFLGGLDFLRNFEDLFSNFWADLSKLMLLITGFCFVYINVKSFIFIRKKRQNNEQL
tara:strand:+ start:90 stop:497 length:408 start_codon:yes stop_codon:yes gene_type:complete